MEENAQVALNVDPTNQENTLAIPDLTSQRSPEGNYPTIFKLPDWITDGNNDLYSPKRVGIGPYRSHYKWDYELKRTYLEDLQKRNRSVDFKVICNEMVGLEPTVRDCYLDNDSYYVEMLVLDGCFIIEFYLKLADLGHAGSDTTAIISDLYLLENQIPFFVIHKLFATIGGCCEPNCSYKNTCPLIQLIFKFPPFNHNNNKVTYKPPTIEGKIHHLLDLLHKAKLPDHLNKEFDEVHGTSVFSSFGEEISPQADMWKSMIPSVPELQKLRVTFRRKRDPRHPFDVTFQRGILEMPFLKFSENTKLLLVNMIAYERSQHISAEKRVFMSYVALMDSLINTDKDVSVLESSGVFKNMLPSDKEAADFFNKLGANILLDYDRHHFSDLFVEVQSFCDSTWQKYKARLLYDFTTNPWALLSVLTGVIALVLTALQTYYSAKH